MRKPATFFLCLAFIAALVWPAQEAFGTRLQSGRQPEPKPSQRPRTVGPPPLPKPPIPEKNEEPETIRISSDLVMLVATVFSEDKAVPNLSQDDFELYEDGVQQDIVHFAHDEDVPLSLIMLFDTSLSIMSRLEFEKRAAARFLERLMRPQDQAALISFGTDVTLMQGFTNDVPLMIRGLKQLKAKGATSLYDALYLASNHVQPAKGRHMVVVVSDGGDTTSKKTLKDALAQAQLADAIIYVIWTGSLWPSENLRDLAAERALAALTSETGGQVFYPKALTSPDDKDSDEKTLLELNETFAKIGEHVRTQYTLGFYPKNDKRDGTFRKLKVQVKRPGLVARTRSGYFSAKDQ